MTGIPHLIVAEDDQQPIAFMGIADQTLEMLFIAPTMRGQGIGKQLIQYCIDTFGLNHVAVNEQNPEAKGFYEHMGFSVYKRTELDEQGNPYPLLYMHLKNTTK
ncbi:GNAT family N-acetyltransferase [Veillonella ratti]|uniref:GNAT family N-acetyltransferase n=1 Tax=Veillonella ratti TaxID=103892 RepID=UPI000F8DDB22|nr:GNAT family N-acetyltransferase [Veillonella ratti]